MTPDLIRMPIRMWIHHRFTSAYDESRLITALDCLEVDAPPESQWEMAVAKVHYTLFPSPSEYLARPIRYWIKHLLNSPYEEIRDEWHAIAYGSLDVSHNGWKQIIKECINAEDRWIETLSPADEWQCCR